MQARASQGGSAGRSRPIDALRALAALGVLAFHVGHTAGANVAAPYGAFTSHLNVGVTLFFLLTGFLLYRPWAAALVADRAGPSLASYARRRILRIVPAYWVALTVLAVWPGLAGAFTKDWWVYYGFAQSYRVDWAFAGLQPAWSLSVEAHYYALLPLYAGALALAARGRSRRARLALAAGGLAVLAVTGMAFCFELTRRGSLFWSPSLPAHLLWFATGMALALARVALDGAASGVDVSRFVTRHANACWGVAAALYASLFFAPGIPRAMSGEAYTAEAKLFEHVVYAAVAAFVMLPAVLGDGTAGLPGRVLGSRWLAQVGLVSYGVFLWHHPLLAELRTRGLHEWIPGWPFLSLALLIVPIALALGALSWVLVERPALRFARS